MSETLHTIPPIDTLHKLPIEYRELEGKGHDPLVSMDTELAKDLGLKKGEIINVDYATLRQTLDAVGAPDDNSSLHIEFSSNQPGDAAQGIYHSTDRKAHIGITPGDIAQSQKTLQHELQHYSDDVNRGAYDVRRGSKAYDVLYDASTNHGEKAIISTGIPFIALGSLNVASRMTGVPKGMSLETYEKVLPYLDVATGSSLVLGLGAIALTSVYFGDKYERRALKAERHIKLPSTISVTRS